MTAEENRREWIAALRSGEYVQGRGYLHRYTPFGEEYTCLGVACDLFLRDYPQYDLDWFHKRDPHCAGILYGPSQEQFGLPEEVRVWLGLAPYRSSMGIGHESLCVTEANGATFEQLADYIESEPDELLLTADWLQSYDEHKRWVDETVAMLDALEPRHRAPPKGWVKKITRWFRDRRERRRL